MRTSRFGVKSLFNIIYATIILLPMFSIFGRLIYTQANPNAKDSYSTTTISKTYNIDTSISSLLVNTKNYIFNGVKNPLLQSFGWGVNNCNLIYSYSSIDLKTYFNKDYNINGIAIGTDANYTTYFRFYLHNSDLDTWNEYDLIYTNSYSDSLNKVLNLNFEFTLSSFGGNVWNGFNIVYPIYTTVSLDNAFEYSLSEFTKDNNLGGVDLFGWFTDLFLTQSNSKNALYLNFINWYMNYTLLVSAGYLIFLALIWFINYVRKILDKSMYHDFGGF